MKSVLKWSWFTMFIFIFCTGTNAQDIAGGDEGDYVKRNVALTKFKLLGVNSKQFAKCVESVNYAEPAKKLGYFILEKIEYADDGEGYDLVARDGIMTSKTVFDYAPGQTVAARGAYIAAKNDAVVHDPAFEHLSGVNSGTGKVKVTIACDVYWQDCSVLPPAYQSICRRMSWPFSGGVSVVNCRFEIEF